MLDTNEEHYANPFYLDQERMAHVPGIYADVKREFTADPQSFGDDFAAESVELARLVRPRVETAVARHDQALRVSFEASVLLVPLELTLPQFND